MRPTIVIVLSLLVLLVFLASTGWAAGELSPKEVYDPFHPAFPASGRRLGNKKAAFELCVRRGELVALIREMKRMEPAIAAIDKRIAAAWAIYLKSGGKFFGWREAYEQSHLRKFGQMPSEYPIPEAIQKDFIKKEIALKRTLSIKRSERAFQAWVEVRLAQLLARDPEGRAKAVAALAKGLKDRSAIQRLRCATLLGAIRDDAAAAGALATAAGSERHPGVLAVLAEGAPNARLLDHAAWPVRAGAIRGFLRARTRAGVEALVGRLPKEGFRLVDDLVDALASLRGERVGADHAAWLKWLSSLPGDWQPRHAPPPPAESEDDRAQPPRVESTGGIRFFGIPLRSRGLVYCVDGSNPRAWEMVRERVVASLETLPDDIEFGLVVYGRKVTRFKKKLVASSPANVQAAEALLKKFEPKPMKFEGNADLHLGMMAAFDLAGGGRNSTPTADTICLVTLRGPDIGLYRSPSQVAQEIVARNRLLGIRIHAVGKSGGGESFYLQDIARQFGGTHVGPR